MKKSNMFYALGILLVVGACKKENPLPENSLNEISNNSQTIAVEEIVQQDGLLKFENHEHARQAINYFSNMSPDQRLFWSQQNGFHSQQMIFDQLHLDQDRFEEIEYAGLDTAITLEEMRSLGYEPKFCPEIERASREGLVAIYTDDDESIWFDLTLESKGIAHIVDNEGFVIIGGDLYQYTNETLKFMEYNDPSNKERLKSTNVTSEGIRVCESGDRANQNYYVGNIFDQACNCWIWYYNSSTERFRHFVYMNSWYDQFDQFIYSDFTNDELAHKRRFWIWRRRNGYKPLHTLNGDWKFTMTDPTVGTNPFYFFPDPTPGVPGDPTDISVSYGNSNEEIEQMYPFGWTQISWPVSAIVDIFDMHIHGTFWGGCCGYHTHYYYQ